MTDRVLIPLPGIGTLELTREVYEAALVPVAAPRAADAAPVPAPELVSAKAMAQRVSLPVSCIYEYARTGRIPCVRAGRHVRFNPSAVIAALSAKSWAGDFRGGSAATLARHGGHP